MAKKVGVSKINFLRGVPSNYNDAEILRIIESTRVKVNEFDERLLNSVQSTAEQMRGGAINAKKDNNSQVE